MRDLHSRMLAALLGGESLASVAELAAAEAGSPVAIVLPTRGLAAASDGDIDLGQLSAAVSSRLGGDVDSPLPGVELEVEVRAADETIGLAVALGGNPNGLPRVELDRNEVLRAAALATLTALAVSEARDEVADELRGTLLEDLRSRAVPGPEIARRAARFGCDLERGAVAMVAIVAKARPLSAAALIASEHPGALAEVLPATPEGGSDGLRVYALLPAREAPSPADATIASAQRIANRLRGQGQAAISSFCDRPRELPRAVAEAELMLEVIGRDERLAEQLRDGIGDGVYRLLFRALASDPEEVRRFYAETLEPLVAHDREYRTDLLGTLETYLAHDCNMNATARAVYAHRHTVAHRLARIRELSGLDPASGEDRERLGLGLKAYRILGPSASRL